MCETAVVVPNGCVGDFRKGDAEFISTFRLPGAAERCTELQVKNPLGPREERIVFHEEGHIYEVDGVRVPRSVTGLVHGYSSDSFKPLEAVRAMKCGKRWQEKRLEFVKADGSEMTEEEIAQHWAFKGKVASARGTLLHYHCEAHLNGRHVAEPRSQEFEQFLLLEAVLAETGYHAFRTEVWSR